MSLRMYLPFGDWSDDGHGKYEKVLIEAPSMEQLLEAQKRIKEKYGERFFDGMADNYQEPVFAPEIWQALIDANYPVERMMEKEDTNDWDGMESIQAILEVDPFPYLSMEFVIDAFIWLLNTHGAEIERLEDYPMICNWTCWGFETVGYGCFL